MKLKEILNTEVFVVKKDDTIKQAMNKMVEKEINGMPVIDEEQNLVGMVVKADIYRFLIEPGHYDSCPVDWVMSKGTITANPNEDILDVAKRLKENHIIAMPVLEEGKVVGIVSIEDLLSYFIKHS
ncbi:MAG: CBS domain-containing protein [Thermotaleaceae bacterium]